MNEQEIHEAKMTNGRIDTSIAYLSDHVMDLSQSDLLVLYMILKHRGFDPHRPHWLRLSVQTGSAVSSGNRSASR